MNNNRIFNCELLFGCFNNHPTQLKGQLREREQRDDLLNESISALSGMQAAYVVNKLTVMRIVIEDSYDVLNGQWKVVIRAKNYQM